MSERLAPLVSNEVDLRDFAFMPLDVLRLRDSDLACVEDAEVFRCAVLSWCVSWHQVPAASLPDDDVLLARLLGFGRDVKGWKRVRAAGGLRGWLLCSDGRMYHKVVAEKALDAWEGKLAQRWRTEAARVKKHNQRHRLDGDAAVQMPEFLEWKAAGCLQGQPLHVPGTKAACPEDRQEHVPRETASKGQGEGQGQGQGDLEESAIALSARAPSLSSRLPAVHAAAPPLPPLPDPPQLTARGAIGLALKAVGLSAFNLQDPRVDALIDAGATPEQWQGLAKEAVDGGKAQPWHWVLAVLPERLKAGKAIKTASRHAGFAAKDYRAGVNDDGTIAAV